MMAETTLTRHPIRGFIWGLITGAGVALLLMVFSVIPLSIPTLGIYTGVSALLGALWGSFAPPKKPKGVAPTPPPAAPGPG
jgi:multisubunit Na+/H+ antiporter MnhB subunit